MQNGINHKMFHTIISSHRRNLDICFPCTNLSTLLRTDKEQPIEKLERRTINVKENIDKTCL